jgi:hypothetical protein
VILQHPDDPPTCSSPMKEQVALLQRIFRANPGAADAVKAEWLKEGVEPTFNVDHMRTRAEALVQDINGYMQATRVLCVTTHKDSEEMWSGYAENHKGIALRIEPSLPKDSKFKLFRPVIYREKRPPLYENSLECEPVWGLADSHQGFVREDSLQQDFEVGARKRVPLGHELEAE